MVLIFKSFFYLLLAINYKFYKLTGWVCLAHSTLLFKHLELLLVVIIVVAVAVAVVVVVVTVVVTVVVVVFLLYQLLKYNCRKPDFKLIVLAMCKSHHDRP